MNKFQPRNVIVTAGASGIGQCIATAFNELGANVHVVDIDQEALDRMAETQPGLTFSHGDVSSESEVQRLFQQHAQSMENVDVMVNCAGVAGPTAPVEAIELEQWHRCLGVNLDATFLWSRAVIPFMKANGKGRIINISSTAGWHGYPLRSPYSAAKWAVIGFTKSLAMELGQFNITANAICPGSVNGERMDRVIAAEAKSKGVSEAEIRVNYTKGCSMRTFIDGEDIANMALYLASPFGRNITGQAISVCGDVHMMR